MKKLSAIQMPLIKLSSVLTIAAILTGCGSVAIYGVPIGSSGNQLVGASKYLGANLQTPAQIDGYLRMLEGVYGKVVEDESGTFIHKDFGSGVVGQFFLSKNLGPSFRSSFSKGKSFFYPLYRIQQDGLPINGQCKSKMVYDQKNTSKLIASLQASRINLLPLENSDAFARLNHRFLQGERGRQPKLSDDAQRQAFEDATGGAALFISDGSNESFLEMERRAAPADWSETGSCNYRTWPTSFTLVFFDQQVVKEAKSGLAHGAQSAFCSIVDWSAEKKNSMRMYTNLSEIERKRRQLEDAAIQFCASALDTLALTRKIRSEPLR